MELTREQAIAEHRKMWYWIAEETERRKEKYTNTSTQICFSRIMILLMIVFAARMMSSFIGTANDALSNGIR